MKKLLAGVLIGLLMVAAIACTGKPKEPQQSGAQLENVTVMLDWVPNTNHTGLYVALAKGFYEEQGLKVTIVEPGQGGTTQLVATGRAHFGVSYQEDVTMARAAQVPIVSVAAILQHNTSGFASLPHSNIATPADLENKRYGGWGSPTEEAVIRAVMEKANADFYKVEFVTIGTADLFTSLERDIDFAWVYYGWDGIEAQRRGIDLNMMFLKDLDPALDYYTPVLITSEGLIANNPQLVERFMAATALGYKFAIDNPAEAAGILVEQAPELDIELVLASQQWLSQQYQADAPQWGLQKSQVWEDYTQWLVQYGLLEQAIEVEKAFTNDFLPNP